MFAYKFFMHGSESFLAYSYFDNKYDGWKRAENDEDSWLGFKIHVGAFGDWIRAFLFSWNMRFAHLLFYVEPAKIIILMLGGHSCYKFSRIINKALN